MNSDIVLLHQEADTPGKSIGHLSATLDSDTIVQIQIIEGKPEFPAALAQDVGNLGIPE
jgi:hypothetical protein